MSSVKLSPIYAALDGHQYSRAIKLCLALPPTHLIGQALLAHAYAKSSQRLKALITLQSILLGNTSSSSNNNNNNNNNNDAATGNQCCSCFPELQLEIKYCALDQQRRFGSSSSSPSSSSAAGGGGGGGGAPSQSQPPPSSAPPQATASAGKKANMKKGKKRSVAASATATSAAAAAKSSAAAAAAAVVSAESALAVVDESLQDFDWIDQLDHPPSIPDNWHEESTAFPSNVEPPTDPTVLATMSTTLGFLRCYLTAYQLYSWVILHCPRDLDHVKQCYLLGLTVWMAPQWYYTSSLKQTLMEQLQVTALQMARLQHEAGVASTATAWAGQTALWQLACPPPPSSSTTTSSINNNNNNSQHSSSTEKRNAKRAMLPRLAESLAQKACQTSTTTSTTTSSSTTIVAVGSGGSGSGGGEEPPVPLHKKDDDVHSFLTETENFLLYLRALTVQGKWEEKRLVLKKRLESLSTACTMHPREDALREEMARVLIQLGQCSEARLELAHLLRIHPDHWDYWKLYIFHDESDRKIDSQLLIAELLKQHHANPQYPLRGPHLARLQRELVLLQQNSSSSDNNDNDNKDVSMLVQEIISYGNWLGHEASCTGDDLRVYIQYVATHGTAVQVQQLMDWIRSDFVVAPSSRKTSTLDAKERHKELRGYIFGIQLWYELYAVAAASCNNNNKAATEAVSTTNNNNSNSTANSSSSSSGSLPDWREMLQLWNDFKALEDPTQAQKENRAGDELILLVVQQLTLKMKNATKTDNDNDDNQNGGCSSSSSPAHCYYHNLVLAATILEAAMEYSPHNAYLKICAILVYANLNAVQRSLELFRLCYIKHIQYESCSYLTLDRLCAGGFYQEALAVCQEILRFQTMAIRDAAEYTGRAMESGTLSKADEFMTFQRDRINKSLTTLETKGLVLDCAPMFLFGESQELGVAHGIVGGPEDKERVCQMICEAHNPHGAFSLLSRLRGATAHDLLECYTENRDLDILSQISILQPQQVASREEILSKSIRRCYHHNLLIRACLCLDATKGPKKGKIIKSPPELTKRCASLLLCVREAEEYAKNDAHQSDMTKAALTTMLFLCRAIVAVSGGITDDDKNNSTTTTTTTETGVVLDKLDLREQAASQFLASAMESAQKCHTAFTVLLQTKQEDAVPVVGNFLSDCLVTLYALLQMCASTFEIYGWGKRKRGTRKSAGALAELSIAWRKLLEAMKSSLLEPPFPMPEEAFYSNVVRDGILNKTQIENCKIRIANAQAETRTRIEQILSKMMESLKTFDVEV